MLSRDRPGHEATENGGPYARDRESETALIITGGNCLGARGLLRPGSAPKPRGRGSPASGVFDFRPHPDSGHSLEMTAPDRF